MKPYALAVPFIALFAGAAVASAPEPITQNISVTATIPGNNFSVEPKLDWMNQPVELEYQVQNDNFNPVTHYFEAQSDLGAIQAKLEAAAELRNTQKTDEVIQLAITVGTELLTLSPVDVMSAEDANTGADLPITFAAIKPGNGYKKGEYEGVVSVLFETSSSSL